MDVGEGDLTSDKAVCTDCPSDLREAILKPRSNKMTPKGEPTAKKFWTGNKRGGSLRLLLSGIGWSSVEGGGGGGGGVVGCRVSISNASSDYLFG